jgi:hypothetical protein
MLTNILIICKKRRVLWFKLWQTANRKGLLLQQRGLEVCEVTILYVLA